MNYNIDSNYTFQKTPLYPVSGEKKEASDKLSGESIISEFSNPKLAEKEENRKIFSEAAMMDLNEVKNFLFMLIGAEVQVKEENSLKSGNTLNMIA